MTRGRGSRLDKILPSPEAVSVTTTARVCALSLVVLGSLFGIEHSTLWFVKTILASD